MFGNFILIAGAALCLALAPLEGNIPTIHVIGDSHSREFIGIPNCNIHWLGPITMHRVRRDGIRSLINDQVYVHDNDVIVFCFGEIDARCHVGKIRDLGNFTQEEVITSLITEYVQVIADFKQLFENLVVVIYTVTPPTDASYNIEFPRYSDINDRLQITKQMNAKLIEVCQEYNFPVLDVYEDYADSMGYLNYYLSDGNVHIHPDFNYVIADKLQRLLQR